MPESSSKNLRLYTIPPSAPFLTTLARAILAGELPLPGGAKPDPLTLPLTTIYLPTRRAGRALRDAFLAEAKDAGMLLPRIRALGDPDEDAAIIFGAGDGAADDGAIATPAIGALRRRLALMRLVLAFGQRLSTAAFLDGAPTFPLTPGQASFLAADLARVMDFVESEQVPLADLKEIGPEEFAGHWQLTVEFLKILTEQWPRYLTDNHLLSPVARRTLLMARETERLAKGSAHPVIAAGSTGTLPATARLLKAIGSLPNGAVVLPGLDKQLDEETWAGLGRVPEHPQHGMAALLRELGATRDDVAYLPGAEPGAAARARLHLTSEALRPAESTDRWEQFLAGDTLAADGRASLANAASGLQLVVAPTAHDEAEAIALILRSAVEAKGKTGALVTPDRTLARRVAARLKRYELAVDDSAGVPVPHTVPGVFLDLVIGAAETNFAPPELVALLKHPLALLGRSPSDARFAARALERGAFRSVYVGEGLDGARAALDAARSEERRGSLRLSEREHDAALKLVADLKAAFAPVTALGAGLTTASRLAEAHAAVAEALARDAAGSSAALWQGDAGEALSVLLAELIEEGRAVTLKPDEYPEFYRSLVAGEAVRPLLGLHPRLFIWGPLEARLQQSDLVILGSLNEGVWPRPEEAGPWLSRPMREKLNLPPPERRIGLSAHDFTQALGAGEVYLTRALKVDGVPTVPSRWLQRLLALAKAAGIEAKLAPAAPWVAWARERDRAPKLDPAKPPEPKPPLEARPRQLSVTRIERWIANPYEIFAKDILKLEKLNALGTEPDPALRGEIVHRALQEFSREYHDKLPADIEEALVAIADRHFAALAGSPVVKAFWRPAFRRFARWFTATEPGRREGVRAMLIEARGSLDLDNSFRLTARADRIDIAGEGSAAIYDYKTGSPPPPSRVEKLVAPQLPLEALIVAEGGFPGLGNCAVSSLRYIHVTGRGEGGEERDAATKTDPETLASEARAKLTRLIARYADPDMPYEVKRRSGPFREAYKYDQYEHLARIKEWLTQEAEEEFG
ncbi:MAG TPA: double-strand break repair protein AddB [Methyloceanibacter sp.]|nr:double-strand break repair protein AddB [Methyloceanibacter sp.]